jgi:hypothetical protein
MDRSVLLFLAEYPISQVLLIFRGQDQMDLLAQVPMYQFKTRNYALQVQDDGKCPFVKNLPSSRAREI